MQVLVDKFAGMVNEREEKIQELEDEIARL